MNFCGIFENSFFHRAPVVTASEIILLTLTIYQVQKNLTMLYSLIQALTQCWLVNLAVNQVQQARRRVTLLLAMIHTK